MTEHDGQRPSGILRAIAVALMGITVAFTLLAAVGTTCVAFGAENFGSMAVLVPYKPLYQALVVVSLAVGIWGIPVTVSLARGGDKAYRNALLVLVLGAISAGIQTGVSQSVRGASAPVNVRFLLTLLTLALFLLLRLPSIWQRVDFTQPMRGGSTGASAGTALVVCGIVTLTVPLWAGPTHLSPSGVNWVDVLHLPLILSGSGMIVAGVMLLIAAVWQVQRGTSESATMVRRVQGSVKEPTGVR